MATKWTSLVFKAGAGYLIIITALANFLAIWLFPPVTFDLEEEEVSLRDQNKELLRLSYQFDLGQSRAGEWEPLFKSSKEELTFYTEESFLLNHRASSPFKQSVIDAEASRQIVTDVNYNPLTHELTIAKTYNNPGSEEIITKLQLAPSVAKEVEQTEKEVWFPTAKCGLKIASTDPIFPQDTPNEIWFLITDQKITLTVTEQCQR